MLQPSSAFTALHKDDVIGYRPIMTSHVRSKSKPPKFSGPPRVRYEPPTIEEAVAVAQDLAPDREQLVAVAAGLIGLPEDQVRSHVLSAPPKRTLSRPARDWAQPTRRLHVDGWRGRVRSRLRPEHPGRPLQELSLPGHDLVGMDIELLGQLSQRLLAPHRSQGHLRFESRCVVPAWSSAHRLS